MYIMHALIRLMIVINTQNVSPVKYCFYSSNNNTCIAHACYRSLNISGYSFPVNRYLPLNISLRGRWTDVVTFNPSISSPIIKVRCIPLEIGVPFLDGPTSDAIIQCGFGYFWSCGFNMDVYRIPLHISLLFSEKSHARDAFTLSLIRFIQLCFWKGDYDSYFQKIGVLSPTYQRIQEWIDINFVKSDPRGNAALWGIARPLLILGHTQNLIVPLSENKVLMLFYGLTSGLDDKARIVVVEHEFDWKEMNWKKKVPDQVFYNIPLPSELMPDVRTLHESKLTQAMLLAYGNEERVHLVTYLGHAHVLKKSKKGRFDLHKIYTDNQFPICYVFRSVDDDRTIVFTKPALGIRGCGEMFDLDKPKIRVPYIFDPLQESNPLYFSKLALGK